MPYYGYGRRWPKYVSVAERRRKAQRKMDQLRKKGQKIHPVEIEGRKIARTFWGKAWCDHMESLGDFANRLPRGRTYVRNGSVCHLEITKGRIRAMVSGSSLYKIDVKINMLPKAKWGRTKSLCAGQIGSLIELLQGKLSSGVMQIITDAKEGLFPAGSEIDLKCNCPDSAYLCKHLAAVLYGVGSRLDENPELLFLLRGVRHEELIDTNVNQAVTGAMARGGSRRTVATTDLADVFGIDIGTTSNGSKVASKAPATTRRKKTLKKAPKKKPAKKKPAKNKSAKKKPTKKKPAKKKPAKKNPTKKKPAKKKSTNSDP